MGSVKKAADAAGRKLCFLGLSLNTYLEAAHLQGLAPFHPRDLIQPAEINDYDPNKILIVTTGSQVRSDLYVDMVIYIQDMKDPLNYIQCRFYSFDCDC